MKTFDRSAAAVASMSGLPTLWLGWQPVCHAILNDGSLAVLATDADLAAEGQRIGAALRASEPLHPSARQDELASAARGRIWSMTSTGAWLEGPTFPIETLHPKIDRFADGRWLVVDALSREANARVLSPNGAVLDRFRLGFGVDHLMIGVDDRIWVGWGDQSISENSDWKVPGEQNAETADAVVCFTDDGTPFFLPVWPVEGQGVVDPEVLSVDGAGAWSCPYMNAIEDFPLIRFTPGEPTRWWRHRLKGATAIASHGNHVLLAGGYGEEANRLALLALDGKGHGDPATVEAIWSMPFHRSTLARWRLWDRPTLLVGRDDTIHLVQNQSWYRWRVQDLMSL